MLIKNQEVKGESSNAEVKKLWVTIGYWSKDLILAKMNYSKSERECLSVLWALKTLRLYIEGTQFTERIGGDYYVNTPLENGS